MLKVVSVVKQVFFFTLFVFGNLQVQTPNNQLWSEPYLKEVWTSYNFLEHQNLTLFSVDEKIVSMCLSSYANYTVLLRAILKASLLHDVSTLQYFSLLS